MDRLRSATERQPGDQEIDAAEPVIVGIVTTRVIVGAALVVRLVGAGVLAPGCRLSHSARMGIRLLLVGLPLAIESVASGFPTTGFDVDSTKVDKLNAGNSYIKNISSDTIRGM